MKFFVRLYFEYFDRIFMEFSTKCRTKNLGMYTPFLEVFAHFLIRKGPLFGPKSGLGKIPGSTRSSQAFHVK